ncbi:stevor PIR protein, putative [Plasmodium reichenowi]|uniref:Stevor PIR protein, putative n=1 Tax=Plasmodium reichenowi TaxID=5854 RepID=A0A2P9D3X6_PLARE|nr:stevor PIR protein, putative [Plasmodium reichenowi]
MNIYFVKILLFNFLINILVSPHNENYLNNHYNVCLIQNNTKRTMIKPRLLAQTQIHNPHYHNDPELKEMIDKLNEEAIKKYQQTHDPYEQLKELVEKKGTKLRSGHGAEPMSETEKELFEKYEEMFGDEKDITLKSGMNPNDDDKSSTCVCANNNNTYLTKRKGKDKYLKHLKGRCTRGIYFGSIGTVILTYIGLKAARAGVVAVLAKYPTAETCVTSLAIFNLFKESTMISAIKVGGTVCANAAYNDLVIPVTGAAVSGFYPWGIAALVLLILVVTLIILYIWLYRRRKNSWKHECKKHLCK